MNLSGTNAVISSLLKLRAIRQFRPDPLPEDMVADLLKVVRWSGSASNQQPWEVVVVSDAATRQELARER